MNNDNDKVELEVEDNEQEPQEERPNLPLSVLQAMGEVIRGLQRRYMPGRGGFRGPTPEHNPNRLKGKGITRKPYNWEKERKRKKQAKRARKAHNRKGSRRRK